MKVYMFTIFIFASFLSSILYADNPVDYRQILVAVKQGKDDNTISKMIKTNNTITKNNEDIKNIMLIYNEIVSRYGLSDKHKKSFETILLFLNTTSNFEELSQVYDETEQLNLLEENADSKLKKGSILISLDIDMRPPKSTGKYKIKLEELTDRLTKDKDLYSQLQGYILLSNYYSFRNPDKSKNYIKKAEMLAKKQKDSNALAEIAELKEIIESNKIAINAGVLLPTNNLSNIWKLLIVLFVLAIIITIIAIRIKKYQNPSA